MDRTEMHTLQYRLQYRHRRRHPVGNTIEKILRCSAAVCVYLPVVEILREMDHTIKQAPVMDRNDAKKDKHR